MKNKNASNRLISAAAIAIVTVATGCMDGFRSNALFPTRPPKQQTTNELGQPGQIFVEETPPQK